MSLTKTAQRIQDREADTVRSAPTREGYYCPTKQTVLDFLATVHMRLDDPKLAQAKRDILEADQDALLGRLSYFLAVETVVTERTSSG